MSGYGQDVNRSTRAEESARVPQVKVRVSGSSESPGAEQMPPGADKAGCLGALANPSGTGEGVGFNPKNTFEAFVVGNSNNFAYAAAQAVARAPGQSYSPLFLHGGVGLGKTHLLHAIGHQVRAHSPAVRVLCVSAEKFINEYVEGNQGSQAARFREKYRLADVLLIDDIQSLAHQERIQEEFFHTFNALHDHQRQIVLTCDRPAGEIERLQRRLVSRFDWGLVTELHAPEWETRLAILRRKAEAIGARVPEAILAFLANRIQANVRELEGALIRVASYTALTGRKLSLEAAEGLLCEDGSCTICIEVVQRKVAQHFAIAPEDLTRRGRLESLVFPRQVAMFIARDMTRASLNAIGAAFGGRDHATVLRACQLVKARMNADPQVRQMVTYLEKQCVR